MNAPMIEVELVYALPQQQRCWQLRLNDEATVADALAAVDWSEALDVAELEQAKVGIFGRVVDRQQLLKTGDRIELYRPLLADPKLARRRRVAAARRR